MQIFEKKPKEKLGLGMETNGWSIDLPLKLLSQPDIIW